jgi:electron transfer flavoprotein beta subunit
MAIGADRGILVESNEDLQPLAVAKLLKALVDKEQPPGDPGQAGHRRRLEPDRPDAGRAGRLPQATFASKVVVADGKASVTREVDGGLETCRSSCRPWSPPTCA